MGNLFKQLFIFIIFIPLKLYGQEILELRVINPIYQRYEGEELVWKLKAHSFTQKGKDFFEAKGVYLENLPKGIKIYANSALYFKKEEKFILKGKVSLITAKEGEVITEELLYYPKKGLLEAPGAVLVKKGSITVSGEGLSYYVNEGDFRVHKRAKAQFKL